MKTTITMPQTFFCREHRAIPARGMGPGYCWRCEIREELWRSRESADAWAAVSADGEWPEGVPTAPSPVLSTPGKSPGSLANLVPRWHPFVLDHSRTEADFQRTCPDDYAHGNWSVITFWREKVQLVSPT